jgi:small-conductance mechanosensitive channel
VETSIDITSAVRFPGVFYGLACLAIGYFAARAVTGSLHRLGERFTDRRLLLNLVGTVSAFFIWLLVIFAATTLSVSLSKEVVIALTGTAAVTIGFALKDLAASMIAGLIIIFDRPFQVGDRVTFGGTYGEVSAIGLRSVRLVTLDDNVVTIPNNKILTETVSSGNWGALDMLIEIDFFVAVDEPIAGARSILEEAVTSCRYAHVERPWCILASPVVQGDCFAVRLRAHVYVLDVKYERELVDDVTERVVTGFQRAGVRCPAVVHRAATPLPSPGGARDANDLAPNHPWG